MSISVQILLKCDHCPQSRLVFVPVDWDGKVRFRQTAGRWNLYGEYDLNIAPDEHDRWRALKVGDDDYVAVCSRPCADEWLQSHGYEPMK